MTTCLRRLSNNLKYTALLHKLHFYINLSKTAPYLNESTNVCKYYFHISTLIVSLVYLTHISCDRITGSEKFEFNLNIKSLQNNSRNSYIWLRGMR